MICFRQKAATGSGLKTRSGPGRAITTTGHFLLDTNYSQHIQKEALVHTHTHIKALNSPAHKEPRVSKHMLRGGGGEGGPTPSLSPHTEHILAVQVALYLPINAGQIYNWMLTALWHSAIGSLSETTPPPSPQGASQTNPDLFDSELTSPPEIYMAQGNKSNQNLTQTAHARKRQRKRVRDTEGGKDRTIAEYPLCQSMAAQTPPKKNK